MKKLFLTLILLSLPVIAAAENSAVYSELSTYHFNATPEKLEQLAGGKTELINELLNLRHSTHPFVSIRAAKTLLNYTDSEEVTNALSSDIDNSKYKGITKAIAINIDSTKNVNSRASFAAKIVNRAKSDSDIKSTLSSLRTSNDTVVKSIAKSAN